VDLAKDRVVDLAKDRVVDLAKDPVVDLAKDPLILRASKSKSTPRSRIFSKIHYGGRDNETRQRLAGKSKATRWSLPVGLLSDTLESIASQSLHLVFEREA
jgi:hypothetical protein